MLTVVDNNCSTLQHFNSLTWTKVFLTVFIDLKRISFGHIWGKCFQRHHFKSVRSNRLFRSRAIFHVCVLGAVVLWSISVTVLSLHMRHRGCECYLSWALMLVWFIGLIGTELDWIRDRHVVGWISSALVGGFRWAKHKSDSSGSPKQIMLKWKQAVRFCHLPPSFPLSSFLSLSWLTAPPYCSLHQ